METYSERKFDISTAEIIGQIEMNFLKEVEFSKGWNNFFQYILEEGLKYQELYEISGELYNLSVFLISNGTALVYNLTRNTITVMKNWIMRNDTEVDELLVFCTNEQAERAMLLRMMHEGISLQKMDEYGWFIRQPHIKQITNYYSWRKQKDTEKRDTLPLSAKKKQNWYDQLVAKVAVFIEEKVWH